MIRIVSDKFIRSDALEEFRALAEKMALATQMEEGCIAYGLYGDSKNPLHFAFIEDWADNEAIKAHNSTEHFKTYVPLMAECCEKPGACYFYEQLD